jgi:predicted ArsR family transcriptional regulator
MSDADSYEHTVCRAAHDAVRALLSAAPDSPEGSAALREVTLRLAQEHGPVAVLDLAEELAVDLAEALGAIASVEQRDAVEFADHWFSDQSAALPDSGGDSGRRDTER